MNLDDYHLLAKQASALISDEKNITANLANLSALLNMTLDDINWVGFYLYEEQSDQLVLGPFQGQPACVRINNGSGVCGAAFKSQTVQRVEDVHSFEGHIACDARSNSEIVLPIRCKQVSGVLDIDSASFSRFNELDEQGLTLLVNKIEHILSK